jgi:hypothetical protein
MSSTSSTLVPPRILVQEKTSSDGVECSIHHLPKPLLREFRHVFGDEYLKRPSSSLPIVGQQSNDTLELIAIPTNQRAREDLVGIGDHIEKEKDRLLNVVSCDD